MKKYPYYLDNSVVDNENWEEYSIYMLSQIKESTLMYYENIYDISGLVRDLIFHCSETHRYDFGPGNVSDVFEYDSIKVTRTKGKIQISFNGKYVYTELENIIPGDWIDDFLKAYDTQTAKIKEIEKKIEQANRKQFIEKYFN